MTSLLVQLAIVVFVIAPIVSLFLAFSRSHGTRQLARFILLLAWLAYGGVTASIIVGLASEDTSENALAEVALDKLRL